MTQHENDENKDKDAQGPKQAPAAGASQEEPTADFLTVDKLKEHIAENPGDIDRLREEETAGKNRKTFLETLDQAQGAGTVDDATGDLPPEERRRSERAQPPGHLTAGTAAPSGGPPDPSVQIRERSHIKRGHQVNQIRTA